jgi:hypothetical protein
MPLYLPLNQIYQNFENFEVEKLLKVSFGIRSVPRQGQPNSWSNLVVQHMYCLRYWMHNNNQQICYSNDFLSIWFWIYYIILLKLHKNLNEVHVLGRSNIMRILLHAHVI